LLWLSFKIKLFVNPSLHTKVMAWTKSNLHRWTQACRQRHQTAILATFVKITASRLNI